MRSAIAFTTLLAAVAFGCAETNSEGSGSTAQGGTPNTGGNGTVSTTSSAKTTGTGGSAARTSTRASAAPTGGNGTGGKNAATGGKSASSGQPAGGDKAEGGDSGVSQETGGTKAAGGSQAAGGKSSTRTTSKTTDPATGGKSSAGGASAGGQATGGKSSAGGASAGGQATGGKSSTSTSSTGGQAAGGDTGAGSGKSAGCGKAPGIASSQYNNGQPINITVGGKQRRYILNVPTNYDNTKPYRLIVAYHQLDGNDKQLYSWQYYGLLPLSSNSTIFVAPNGQKNGSPCSGTGNGDSGCGWPNSGDSDLALADAVVAQIEENFCVDTTRIFATGWSYGGSMSYRTACSRPQGGTAASWGVRGIAIYAAAQLSGNCTPTMPVAFYHAHGTHDSVLNYDSMGLPLAQNFAKANGCTWATPTKVTSGTHVCTNMTGCKEGYPLEFCSFNGDHTPFPDNGQQQGSWGPAEAWKFLSQF